MRSFFLLFTVLWFLLAPVPMAQAALWQNSTGDDLWSTAGNWKTGIVPGGTGYTTYVYISCASTGVDAEKAVINYAAPTLEDSRLLWDQYAILNVISGGSITLGDLSCVGRAVPIPTML